MGQVWQAGDTLVKGLIKDDKLNAVKDAVGICGEASGLEHHARLRFACNDLLSTYLLCNFGVSFDRREEIFGLTCVLAKHFGHVE